VDWFLILDNFLYLKKKALRYLTTGPMCKRAEDLMPLLRVIAGPDGIDEKCRSITLGDPNTVDVTKLNFYSNRNGPSRFFFLKRFLKI